MKKLSAIASILIITVLVVIAFPRLKRHFIIQAKPPDMDVPLGTDCGPRALQVICQFAGRDTALDELTTLCSTTDNGTTVANLFHAAEQKGFETQAAIMNIRELQDRLRKTKQPIIVFVDGDHFIVVTEIKDNNVHTIDSPGLSKRITVQAFEKRWQGHAFILTEKSTINDGPAIRFDRAMYDFGEVAAGRRINHIFQYTNVGNKILKIASIQSSCNCTTNHFSHDLVLPAKSGEIPVIYTAKGVGKQTEQLKVFSNDPIKPVTVLTITGNVRPLPFATPPKLFFTTKNSKKEIHLRQLSQGAVRILKLDATSPNIITHDYESGSNVNGQSTISVSLDESTVSQSFRAKLLIHIDHPDVTTIEVPIQYTPAAAIKVTPARIFMGITKSDESLTYSVSIRSKDDNPFEITDVTVDSPYLTTKTTEVESAKEFALEVGVRPNAPEGIIKETIKVHTSREMLSIPFFGNIQK